MKKFDKAKEYNQRRIEIEPNNPEPYYWIGVLDWADALSRGRKRCGWIITSISPKTRTTMNCRRYPPIFARIWPRRTGRWLTRDSRRCNKAIELKPNDADSMVYLNLMYRQKAEIDPDDDTRQADLKQAEDWVNKALAARKAGTASGSSEATPSAAQ